MFFKICLSSLLLSSVALANSLQNYSDYQTLPIWSSNAFDALLKAEVISGTDSGELKPNSTINRAEFLKILLNATNQTLVTPHINTFNDVQQTQWFYPYVETAKSLNWVDGYPDGSFKPGNNINRAEMAKLINKAFGIKTKNEPTDSAWYDADVRALAGKNLLPYNVSKSAFGAGNNPTRAEAFEQIHRAMQLNKADPSAPETMGETKAVPPTIMPTNNNNGSRYEVTATFADTLSAEAVAGDLNLQKSSQQAKSRNVTAGQQNVSAANITIQVSKAPVKINGVQFRRVGNGSINNFKNLWVELNGVQSQKLQASQDLVAFNFPSTVILDANRTYTLELKTDISSQAKPGSSERFVLFLNDWISSNAQVKIGFFPLGGTDIITN